MSGVMPTRTRTCMVLPMATSATAWSEKTGASVAPVSAVAAASASAASSISNPTTKKRRRQHLM
jgi:hypothetical protein